MRKVTAEVPEDATTAVVITNNRVMLLRVSEIKFRNLGERRFHVDGSTTRTAPELDFWFEISGRPIEIVSIPEAESRQRCFKMEPKKRG